MRQELNKINVTMLSVLEALYLTRKTTLAAERLGLAQPSISVYLKQLRELTGDALFIRAPHGLEPTAFCHDYCTRVSTMLDQLQMLATMKNAVFDPATMAAQFSVIIPFVKGRMLFEELSLNLVKKFPKLKADMINLGEQEALKDVEEGLADIYIGLVSEKLDKQFSSVNLLKTELVVLCSRKNPHFKSGRIGKDAYLATPHIKATASFAPSLLDAKFRRAGLLQKTLVSVPDIWAEIELLRETDYLLLIDRNDVGFLNDNASFRVLETDFKIPQFDLYGVWHARRDADPSHQWYRGYIADTCRKYAG